MIAIAGTRTSRACSGRSRTVLSGNWMKSSWSSVTRPETSPAIGPPKAPLAIALISESEDTMMPDLSIWPSLTPNSHVPSESSSITLTTMAMASPMRDALSASDALRSRRGHSRSLSTSSSVSGARIVTPRPWRAGSGVADAGDWPRASGDSFTAGLLHQHGAILQRSARICHGAGGRRRGNCEGPIPCSDRQRTASLSGGWIARGQYSDRTFGRVLGATMPFALGPQDEAVRTRSDRPQMIIGDARSLVSPSSHGGSMTIELR